MKLLYRMSLMTYWSWLRVVRRGPGHNKQHGLDNNTPTRHKLRRGVLLGVSYC